MALKAPAPEAVEIAIASIGRGYNMSTDLQLKYCKGESHTARLIEIDDDGGRDIILPGGITIPNVPKSIKCDKGERTRFRSGVLSFQQRPCRHAFGPSICPTFCSRSFSCSRPVS
ncbi:hypothetical protein PS1_022445 [Malus domestica]